jgi:Putative zinc-finger
MSQQIDMNDHERFLLLAAKRIAEPLTREEEAEVEAHLASCPSCRAIAGGMRRDDIRLHAALAPVPVSSRVRRRVMSEASGSGRTPGPMILLLAAALAVGVVGFPLFAGALRQPSAPESPSPSVALVSPTPTPAPPSPTASPSIEATPVAPPSASLPAGQGPSVAGNYKYGIRTDSLAARLVDGKPVGEWWRSTTVKGKAESYGGPITCLIVKGKDAWLAGPATTATDGRTDHAIMFRLHDGGPNGNGDEVVGYLTNPGQTITTMQFWCETEYTPAGPYPLTSGDVTVDDGTSSP